MIPYRPYALASDDVRWGIFKARSAEDAHGMARFLEVDYLVVGVRERRAYRAEIARLVERPDLFSVVFANDAITVFEVEGHSTVDRHVRRISR